MSPRENDLSPKLRSSDGAAMAGQSWAGDVFRSAIPRGSISPPRGVAVASFIRNVSLGAGAEDAPGFTVDHALEDHPQGFRIARVRQRLFLRHFAREHQLLERLIKTLHALG